MSYFNVILILTLLLSFVTNNFVAQQINNSVAWRLALSSKEPRQFMLGYENIIATNKWIETIALYGEVDSQPSFQEIYKNIDFITSLNPLFQAPYYLAATLPWNSKTTKESNALLTKAIKFMPDIWYWPYYLGFNAYWFDHDQLKASNYLSRAATLPDSPPIVMRLALRMQTDTGQFNTALMFIERQIETATDGTIQKQLIQHRVAILTEKTLYNIERLLKQYPPYERNQQAIQKLIQSGYHIPRLLPDGGHIIFNHDGSLVSSKSKKRFKLFIPAKHQGVTSHESAH